MKFTLKQKRIAYICIVLIILLALFANAFITERYNPNTKVDNNQVEIYQTNIE